MVNYNNKFYLLINYKNDQLCSVYNIKSHHLHILDNHFNQTKGYVMSINTIKMYLSKYLSKSKLTQQGIINTKLDQVCPLSIHHGQI